MLIIKFLVKLLCSAHETTAARSDLSKPELSLLSSDDSGVGELQNSESSSESSLSDSDLVGFQLKEEVRSLYTPNMTTQSINEIGTTDITTHTTSTSTQNTESQNIERECTKISEDIDSLLTVSF